MSVTFNFTTTTSTITQTAWLIGYTNGDNTNVLSCCIIENNKNLMDDWKEVSRMIPYNLKAVGLYVKDATENSIKDQIFSTDRYQTVLPTNFIISNIDTAFMVNGNAKTIKKIDINSNVNNISNNKYIRATLQTQTLIPILPNGNGNEKVFKQYVEETLNPFLPSRPESNNNDNYIGLLPNNQIITLNDKEGNKYLLPTVDYFKQQDVPKQHANMGWKSHQFHASLGSSQASSSSSKGKKGKKGGGKGNKGKGKKKGGGGKGGGSDDKYKIQGDLEIDTNPILTNITSILHDESNILNIHLRRQSSSDSSISGNGQSSPDSSISGNGVILPNGTQHVVCKMNCETLVFVIDESINNNDDDNKNNTTIITIDKTCNDGLNGLYNQFDVIKDSIFDNEKNNQFSKSYQNFHFAPKGLSHLITLIINMDDAHDYENSEKYKNIRASIHKRFAMHIPANRPMFKLGCAINFSAADDGSRSNDNNNGYTHITNNDFIGGVSPTPFKLKNVHVGLKKPGDDGTKLYLVHGEYIYYHYMQDRYDDKGWGCAYRSLQTLVSWFRFNNYTTLPVPSHREIQEVLVDAGEKKRSFVGTKDWIGSQEVGRYLEHVLNVTFKIIFVRTGEELGTIAREVAKHFETQGTPIMIGGGALAFTIIGVAWNDQTGLTEYLILDPHYCGEDVLNTIQDRVVMLEGYKATACGWRGIDTFSKKDFYSLCCPQRPDLF